MLSQVTRASFRSFLRCHPIKPRIVLSRIRMLSKSEDARETTELEVVKVEEAGKEAWSGVAQLEVAKQQDSALSKVILVAGDTTALLLFAIIGRWNHGETVLDFETFSTAAPFVLSWYISCYLLDGYGADAQSGKVLPAASRAVKCWLLSTPLGLGLRGIARGYVPPLPFAIVASVTTFVLLVGWRSGFAAVMPPKDEGGVVGQSRQGNPFEFFSFLSSIVRRW